MKINWLVSIWWGTLVVNGLKSSNNPIISRLTGANLSLWREVFISVVEALHCSGYFSTCRGVHFRICEEDHGATSAMHLALTGCQDPCSCGILQYISGLQVSTQSINTDLNLWLNLNLFCMWSGVRNGHKIANSIPLPPYLWNSTMGVHWYCVCSLYFGFC